MASTRAARVVTCPQCGKVALESGRRGCCSETCLVAYREKTSAVAPADHGVEEADRPTLFRLLMEDAAKKLFALNREQERYGCPDQRWVRMEKRLRKEIAKLQESP